MSDEKTPCRGRAAGKVILFGEHAVVHGAEAVALSLNRGVLVLARRHDGPMTLRVNGLKERFEVGDGRAESRALEALCRSLEIDAKHVRLDATMEIPTRAGLGSSAALATATARALISINGRHEDRQRLFNAVQASERIFHGNPSGLDTACAIDGGLLRYSRAAGVEHIDAPRPIFHVVHSGLPGDTKVTVAQFAKRLEETGSEGAARLKRIGDITRQGLRALLSNDRKTLGTLMVQNHEQLKWFGVSSTELDQIVDIAIQNGALGAKLTGGGGGGCAVVLLPSDDNTAITHLKAAGFQTIAT